jgi:hypothetical protein
MEARMSYAQKSSGNVFADIGCQYPNAQLALADMRIAYEAVLREPVPAKFKKLLAKLK